MTEHAIGDRVRAARQAMPETFWDASDGDLAEQQQPVEPEPELSPEAQPETPGPWSGDAAESRAPALPAEADPADVIEQQQAVPAEPDEYR